MLGVGQEKTIVHVPTHENLGFCRSKHVDGLQFRTPFFHPSEFSLHHWQATEHWANLIANTGASVLAKNLASVLAKNLASSLKHTSIKRKLCKGVLNVEPGSSWLAWNVLSWGFRAKQSPCWAVS